MNLTRREFAALAAAVAAGCESSKDSAAPGTPPSETSGPVDAGPLSEFKADMVYDAFREQGFFLINRDQQLFALSSVCTHKGCKVRLQEDQSFKCKCHGSIFDKEGHVTKGPAERDLPRLAVATDERSHLLVDPHQTLPVNPTVKAPSP